MPKYQPKPVVLIAFEHPDTGDMLVITGPGTHREMPRQQFDEHFQVIEAPEVVAERRTGGRRKGARAGVGDRRKTPRSSGVKVQRRGRTGERGTYLKGEAREVMRNAAMLRYTGEGQDVPEIAAALSSPDAQLRESTIYGWIRKEGWVKGGSSKTPAAPHASAPAPTSSRERARAFARGESDSWMK